jgi:uncharacterized repeat protein (TIGR03803 family)
MARFTLLWFQSGEGRVKMHRSRGVVGLAVALMWATSVLPAQAQTFTVLHTFSGLDGSGPDGSLVQDAAGNLYGTTYFGGTYTGGVAFKLDNTGNETVLFDFNPYNSNGAFPGYGFIIDKEGNVYSPADAGSAEGGGVLWELSPDGNEKVLWYFGGCRGCFKPSGPEGRLLMDASGNLYGVTQSGGVKGKGTQCEYYGCGVVFKLDTAGNLRVLHAFTGGNDGGTPYGALLQDAAGNLYGAAITGGDWSCPQFPTLGCGTVFKLTPDNKFTVLHAFTGGRDGAGPYGGLVMDSAGNLYGSAHTGGNSNCDDGCGTLFKIDANGKFKVLYTFTNNPAAYPIGNLVMDPKGNIYGETQGLNTNSYYGTVFELNSAGKVKLLHILNGSTDGADPNGGLIRDSAGNLYGVAYQGFGLHDRNGTVFKVTP